MSYTKNAITKLIQYKWFRRLCGGYWILASKVDEPAIFLNARWYQFKKKLDLPTSKEELKMQTTFSNIFTEEYWGDAYTYVDNRINR